MAQVISSQPLNTEAWVHAWVCPFGICDGQFGTGTGFSLSSSAFSCPRHSPWLSILIYHLGDEQQALGGPSLFRDIVSSLNMNNV
jgi:hypothetical protein